MINFVIDNKHWENEILNKISFSDNVYKKPSAESQGIKRREILSQACGKASESAKCETLLKKRVENHDK